ncbi:hypothetical protein I552_10244 [Mycobacterium xenopi 3993]|nr:hypothetical protein I552_10244 [Mycobacterium xenopi 3993]
MLAALVGLAFLGYWAYQRSVDRRAEQARIAPAPTPNTRR